jgi:hypothetical protein
MIKNNCIIEIINDFRDAHVTSKKEIIMKLNITDSPFPKNIVKDMDCWLPNILNIFYKVKCNRASIMIHNHSTTRKRKNQEKKEKKSFLSLKMT